MAQELAFEVLALAQQATLGTGIAQPTHYLPLEGMIKVDEKRRFAKQNTGTLAENWRSTRTDVRGAFSAKGDYANGVGPLLMMSLMNGATPTFTTPAGATLGRLVTFTRRMTSLNLKTLSTFFSDPNVRAFRAIDTALTEAKFSAKASDDNGALELDVTGFSKFAGTQASLTLPSQILGSTFAASDQQVWLYPFGGTLVEITGTVAESGVTIKTGQKPKKTAQGPGTLRSWNRLGVEAASPEAMIEVELDDYSIYDYWSAQTLMQLTIRYNGAFIENVTAVPTYEYIEFKMKGYLESPDMGENAGTNRTHKYTLSGMYDATAATDLTVAIQTTATTV